VGENEIIIFIIGAIFGVAIGQFEAAGSIGNRPYSVWYSTHFLVEKKGICRWIYFKPKHFERYTLYEVISFFASYLLIFVFGMLGAFRYVDWLSTKALYAITFSIICLLYLSTFAVAMINEIGFRKDEKKRFYLEAGERDTVSKIPESAVSNHAPVAKAVKASFYQQNHTYFNVYHLWDSYRVRLKEAKDDAQKRNQVNLDYIEYFKNIKHLIVVKENKNGSLQLKIKKQ